MTFVNSRYMFAATLVLVSLLSFCSTNVSSQIIDEAKLPENGKQEEAKFLSNDFALTSSGGSAGEGYFSADGKFLVFQSERIVGNPFYQIYRMNMENGETKQVSPGHGKTTCAWIHPTNGDIIFASTHDDPDALEKQKQEIKERETSTTRRYSWSYDEFFDIYRWDSKTEKYTNLTNQRGYDAEGSYSPDGEWICFASNRQAYDRELTAEEKKEFETQPEYFMDLYIMKADGSELTRLTDKPGYDGGPFFSPDGSRICWRSFNEAGTLAEIWTMNVDGSDKKQLTRLNAMSWAPYYHPSGKYLIFTTNRHGYANFELYLVDAEGMVPPRRVTYTAGFDGLPVFSPDGNQLVWASERNAQAGEKINSQQKPGAQLEQADWNHKAALLSLGISPEENSLVEQQIQQEAQTTGGSAAGATSPEYDKNDVMRHVMYLCDPKLKGRMTGSAGERQATAYVAAYMDAIGIKPAGDNGSWFQKFDYPAGAELGSECRLTAGNEVLQLDEDWRPLTFSLSGEISAADIVFAGYGITAEKDENNAAYNSYIHLDVKDKWVMIFRHFPEDVDDDRRQFLSIHSTLARKAMELRDLGAKGMVVVSGPNSHFKDKLVPLQNDFSRGKTSLAAISISDEVAAKWLKSAGKDLAELQTQLDSGEQMMGFALDIPDFEMSANIDIKQNRGIGQNVVGRLQFGDKPSEQVIVVGAHVDHLGDGRSGSSLASADEKTLIHFGADDNASGVAAMLEVAEYMANLKRTGATDGMQRDIIFAAWSGEELGLHGSNHFVSQLENASGHSVHGRSHGDAHSTPSHGNITKADSNVVPDAPRADSENPHAINPHAANPHEETSAGGIYPAVSAYLNMDMVGRYTDKLQLQGLGSSDEWGTLIETANFKTRFRIAKVLDTNLPTDATGFYRAGVPILAAFTGSHSDYHTPRDTPDKINYLETAKVANLIGNLAIALSEKENPLAYKEYNKSSGGRSGGTMGVVYLGTHPDYGFEGTGVRITGVTEGSPSEKAGLSKGDVIVELGGKVVENVNEYMIAIGSLKIGRETTVVVIRDDKRESLKIVPGIKE